MRPVSSRSSSVVVRAVVLGLVALFGLSACQTRPKAKPFKTLGWEKHRLPNSPRPYAKLLVEIDAVEGSEPSAAEMKDLKGFLEQITDKPGGVTVKLDDLIAPARARGRAPDSLALEYLDGPDDEQTAFVYVLCYRGRLSPFVNPENPHFTYYPYPCAVFINRSYAFGWFAWLGRARQLMMRHEIGHALGLADNASHSRNGHCTNAGCLMLPGVRFNLRRLITFRSPWDNPEFCADCRGDLETYKRADAAPGAGSWRGYFVRSGEGYHVLTLPGLVYVHFGEFARLDADRLAAFRRKSIGAITQRGDLLYEAHGDQSGSAEGLRRFVERETESDGMKQLAKNVLEASLAQAERLLDSKPAEAREIIDATRAAAALKFPELHAKLQALHDRLTAKLPGQPAPGVPAK